MVSMPRCHSSSEISHIGVAPCPRDYSGVVEENIHLAELGYGGFHEGVDLGGVGDVGGYGDGLASEFGHHVGDFLDRADSAGGDYEVGAGARHGQGHFPAESGAAACYHDAFAF